MNPLLAIQNRTVLHYFAWRLLFWGGGAFALFFAGNRASSRGKERGQMSYDASDEVRLILGTVQDITELKGMLAKPYSFEDLEKALAKLRKRT